MDVVSQRTEFFQESIYKRRWIIPVVATLLYLVSAAYVGLHREIKLKGVEVQHQPLSVLCILFWAAAPLLFFLLEYVWIGSLAVDKLPSVEAFKYSQDLASKFWAVGVVVLVFLYAGKIPGG